MNCACGGRSVTGVCDWQQRLNTGRIPVRIIGVSYTDHRVKLPNSLPKFTVNAVLARESINHVEHSERFDEQSVLVVSCAPGFNFVERNSYPGFE